MAEKTCSICSRHITLDKNLSGLVFNDKHFICAECRKNTSNEDLTDWSKTIMQSPTAGMPIALWIIHEQNKDKIMMSRKKN